METAKTGSKLAQLQALRGQKQKRQSIREMVHALHSEPRDLRALNQHLMAENIRLKAENVMLRASSSGNVTCPKCEAAKKANAERVRASRARRKKK